MTTTIVNGQIVEKPPVQLKSIELFYAITLCKDTKIAAVNGIDISFLSSCAVSLVHRGTGGQNDLIKVIAPSNNVIYYVGQWNDGLVNPPKKKPIVFKAYLGSLETIENVITSKPSEFEYIELLVKNYLSGTDLIYAYMNPNHKEEGTLYLGNWNDGVIE